MAGSTPTLLYPRTIGTCTCMDCSNIIMAKCATLLPLMSVLTIMGCLYYLTTLLPLLATPQSLPPASTPSLLTRPQGATIHWVMMVSSSPSRMLAERRIPVLEYGSSQLQALVVWDPSANTTTHQHKQQFVALLHNFAKLSTRVFFLSDYVDPSPQPQVGVLESSEKLRKYGVDLSRMDAVILDADLDPIVLSSFLRWMEEDYSFMTNEMADMVEGINNWKSRHQCTAMFQQLMHNNQVKLVRTNGHNNLVISYKMKEVQALAPSSHASSFVEWLWVNQVNTLAIPYPQEQKEQQQTLQLLLSAICLASSPLTVRVQQAEMHNRLTRNLILNDVSAEIVLQNSEDAGAVKFWNEQATVALYDAGVFMRQLDWLRARIIGDGARVVLLVATTGLQYLDNLRSQFSVTKIDSKLNKGAMAGDGKLVDGEGLYLIQKTQKINKKQKKIAVKQVGSGYNFTDESLSPLWIRQGTKNQLNHCFYERYPSYGEHFIIRKQGFVQNELIAYIKKQQKNKNILWCFLQEYTLFQQLGYLTQIQNIVMCKNLQQRLSKKLLKMAILNDFGGKIGQQSNDQINFQILMLENSQVYEITPQMSRKGVIISKEQKQCSGKTIETYCVYDHAPT